MWSACYSVVKDYTISIVCKKYLTDFSNGSNPTFIVNKYNNVISSKFKIVKFTLLLENTPVEAEISRDQVDWFSSLEEELIQVQE